MSGREKAGATARQIRFGEFEVDVSAGEVSRNGQLVRLQEQPFLVLLALLDRAGQVVTRDELRERLWPGESFGDFDQGLNTAINKVREALGDSAVNPRFIETLPKRGYRFTHTLEGQPAAITFNASKAERPWPQKIRLPLPVAIALAAGLCVVALLSILRPSEHPELLPLRRFTLGELPPNGLTPDVRRVAISPSGKHVAFTDGEDQSRLWIRDLDQQQPRVIEGTEGAFSPFWSPDSRMIGFTSLGKLRKVSIAGGPIVTLCDLPGSHVSGGSWSPDGGSIVFTAGGPASLYIVPATGGRPSLLVSPQMLDRQGDAGEARQGGVRGCIAHPHFLPAEHGSAAVLFTWFSGKSELILQDLKTRRLRVIGSGSHPFYSPTGHLLYRSGPDLCYRPFSTRRAQFTGEAQRVAPNATDPTIASDGTLVYRDEWNQQLTWVDRTGTRLGSAGPPANGIYYPTLSIDGRQVAIETWEPDNLELWVSDLDRATRIRLTSHPATDILPVWAPEGDHVAFSSYRAGNTDIFVRRSDASSEERVIAAAPVNERVSDWSQDGQYIVYSLQHPANGSDLWYLKRVSNSEWKSYPFLETSSNEWNPKLSPDGRYVAYASDESGRYELYVRPFPSGERKWPISNGGASQVRWSRRSSELFYTEGRTLMAVSVKTTPALSVGATHRLFSHPRFVVASAAQYDVSPDGQRILLAETVATRPPMIHLVQNWAAGFRDSRKTDPE